MSIQTLPMLLLAVSFRCWFWATTTNKKDFKGSDKDILAGAWYAAANYSLIFGGRKTNFGISYGESYNSTNIPITLTASPLKFGRSSRIKKQLIVFLTTCITFWS